MAFWSGEKLVENLSRLVDTPAESMIDCSAITLKVGAEAYVSPVKKSKGAVKSIQPLAPAESFGIPPGQLAFLISEERVFIPDNAMGLISMKAHTKWHGLINISGFHVDPGYKGRLIFAVLNGGPATVHLRRGDPCFLLWLSDLDRLSGQYVRKKAGYDSIPADLVNHIAGEFKTVAGLSERLDELNTKVTALSGVALVLITAVIAIGALLFNQLHPIVLTPPASSTSAAPTQQQTHHDKGG